MGIENTELASLPDYQINISFFQKYPHTKIEEKKQEWTNIIFALALDMTKAFHWQSIL